MLQKSFSLAKASGIKAAKYVMQTHPDLFENPLYRVEEAELRIEVNIDKYSNDMCVGFSYE